MSAAGALVIAVSAIVVLGAVAAWLINVPIWLIAAFLAVGGLVVRRLLRRLSQSRARQDTEAKV